MNFFAMAGLCSAGMASALLFSPAAVATNADFASSEAIICVECTSEAAARSLALSKVPQLQCHSTDGRQPEMGEDGSSNMFCSALNKRVLVLSPENNYIYSYVVVYRHPYDGAADVIVESGAAVTHAERQYFTKMMDDYIAVARLYNDLSQMLGDIFARPVAQMAPANDANLSGQNASSQCPSELQATALKVAVDEKLLLEVHDSARAIFAANINDSNKKNVQAEEQILTRLTNLNVAINNGIHGDSLGIKLTSVSHNALKLTVPFKRRNEVGQLNDYLVFNMTYSGSTNTYYEDLNGDLVYTEHFPLVSFKLNVPESLILGDKGFTALNGESSDNPCVAAELKKAAKKQRIRPVVSGDHMQMYMPYHDVTVKLNRTFFCYWDVFDGQGNYQYSTWCNRKDRGHRKEP